MIINSARQGVLKGLRRYRQWDIGDGVQYCWLSSFDLPRGADALSALRPGLRIIATAGVAANHSALIEMLIQPSHR